MSEDGGRAADEVEARLRFQSLLLGAVGQALVAMDLEGTVTYWNAAAERIYGWTATDVVGHRVFEVLQTRWTWEQAAEMRAAGERGERWGGTFPVCRRDGTAIPVCCHRRRSSAWPRTPA